MAQARLRGRNDIAKENKPPVSHETRGVIGAQMPAAGRLRNSALFNYVNRCVFSELRRLAKLDSLRRSSPAR
jgi:hypothetical protein